MMAFFTDGWPMNVSLSITVTATDETGEVTSTWQHSGDSLSCDGSDWAVGGLAVEILNYQEAKRNHDNTAMKKATESMGDFVLNLREEQGMKTSRRFGKRRCI